MKVSYTKKRPAFIFQLFNHRLDKSIAISSTKTKTWTAPEQYSAVPRPTLT